MGIPDIIANEISRHLHDKHDEKEEQRHRFIIDALGELCCLAEPMPESMRQNSAGPRLSLDTIYYRISDLQSSDPDRAEQCGMAALDDPERKQKIKRILNEMCGKGLLKYHRLANKWSIVV